MNNNKEIKVLKKVVKKQMITQSQVVLSNRDFKLFVESVKDVAIFMLDPQGNIMSWNSGAEALNNYCLDEAIGKPFNLFYEKLDIINDKPQDHLNQAIQEGKCIVEGWMVRKNGSRYWANVIITSMRDKAGVLRGFGMLVYDLTAKKQEEERLKLALHERDQALRDLNMFLQEKDELITMASHEILTPLTAILLHLNIMASDLKRNFSKFYLKGLGYQKYFDSFIEIVNLCKAQGKKMAEMLQQVLSFSRVRLLSRMNLNVQKMDLTLVARDTVKRLTGKHFESKILFTHSEPVIGYWDQSRIEQCINNLASNAIKYGGDEPIQVSVQLNKEKKQALILIKDHGEGIPKKYQEKIFDCFERTKDNLTNGFGLGLYITRKIVEAHGGEIFVQSQIGKGTTFKVSLPLIHK